MTESLQKCAKLYFSLRNQRVDPDSVRSNKTSDLCYFRTTKSSRVVN